LREAVGGPDNEHFDPIGYVERGDAPDREKLKQLEEWQSELIQLQKATEENMPATGARVGQTAARLAKVTAALELIRERIG
jgi:hypothetical protein